jgi:bifunctional UDP-N-acetylglucosamine pyrophosphorylase/glucosamine-1-phosphate N-acetyltransferase
MLLQDIYTVVLAAGRSSRFLGPDSKLLTKLAGQELVLYPLQLLEALKLPKNFVLGHAAERIKPLLESRAKFPINFAYQLQQLGTGDALACSQENWQGKHILVLNADMPLLSTALLENLATAHTAASATITFGAFCTKTPNSYGRVVQSVQQIKIVESKDCNEAEKQINLVNAGVYLFERNFLEENIHKLDANNMAQEFYLTDLIGLGSAHGQKIQLIEASETEALGINTLQDFAVAETALRSAQTFWQKIV